MRKNIWIYIITGILLIVFGFIFVTQQFDINDGGEEKRKYNAETAEENAKKEKLEAEIENSGKRETIEARAREELGLVYPDEKKYVDING